MRFRETRRERFKSLPWSEEVVKVSVDVIGAGGIGSWLSIFLNRTGTIFRLVDNDTVDESNLGGQAYYNGAVGMSKTIAIGDMISMIGQHEPSNRFIGTVVEEMPNIGSITFSCLDSIRTRAKLFERWAASWRGNKAIFIDGRMLAEDGEVYAVDASKKEHMEAYRTTLFEPDARSAPLCTARATSHCGALTAIFMLTLYTNFMTNKAMGMEIRDVPFKTEFHLPMMDFEVNFLTKEDDFKAVNKK